MRKSIVVAFREYTAAVRTKAFIITMIAMPIMMGGSLAVQIIMKDKVDIADKRVGVVDRTGQLFDALAASAGRRNDEDIHSGEGAGRKQVRPRYLVQRIEPESDDLEKVKVDLSERVRAGEYLAFVVIGKDVVKGKTAGDDATISYYSNSPTYDDFLDWMREPVNQRIRDLRLREAGLDSGVVSEAVRPTWIRNLGLYSVDESGQVTRATETNRLASLFVPMGTMMLMFMVIMVVATPMMQSVLEEKTQRIAEVLLGSVTPFELMLGKLLGSVGVSLTIVTVYLTGGYLALLKAGYEHFFPGHLVWWFVVYQSLAILLYGSLFMAIGAAVSDIKEAQSLMTPVTLICVAPMFVWLNVVKEPSAPFSVAASLFPPATPMLMILRQSVPPGVPAWQPAMGVALVLLTSLLCVFAAGRIFRVGILMQGKGAKLGELLRWVVRG